MRFGPFSLKSTIALSNLGVDTNVFSKPDGAGPERDFTMMFTPTTYTWFRMGRTWMSGIIAVDWVYFKKFSSQRGANSTYQLGVARRFNRLALKSGASRISTRVPPNYDIDLRSQRFEKSFNGEVELRVLSKTYVAPKASYSESWFDKDALLLGTSLARELNMTRSTSAIAVRHDLTPLTGLSLEVGRDIDLFEFTPLKNAASTRVMGTVTLQPLALINGSAMFGYRQHNFARTDVPPYRGPIAAINLSYKPLVATKLGLALSRDVKYAVNPSQPYFVETAATVTVQQRIYGPFDALAKVGSTLLAYRDLVGAVVEVSNRLDLVNRIGIGAGYRLGLDKRIGFTLDHVERLSNLDSRRFSGLRLGFSVTYER